MELDPRLTFESFVVGPANRLAAAAARRAAEHPGRSYNPLFLYSPSGLGKSHILSAIAHQSRKNREDRTAVYQPLEMYLGELTNALKRGEGEALEARYAALDVLLLDDVQFLTGQSEAQEILLRTLDAIMRGGGQVVLASDRPPSDIDGLDARLMSRFSGGLIVDMGPPDLETRVAILRRKASERSAELAEGVAEALARFPFRNVRELQGGLNRILAVQDLEERAVEIAELPQIVGVLGGTRRPPVSRDAPELEAGWRGEVRRLAGAADAEGFATQRLDRLLRSGSEPPDWEAVLRRYRTDIARTREIRAELDEVGNPWPEAAATLLQDPDRIEEAEALLASARERARPFPELPAGPTLEDLDGYVPPLAMRAAMRLLTADRPDYNPLYIHAGDRERARVFLAATGRSFLAERPDARVGYVSVTDFAEEYVRAISDGVAGAWRERWWTVEVLLLHGLEELSKTERAQDEFFHLFEALKRRDARIFLVADRLPAGIDTDERLRSRFEGGLVVDLEGEPLPPALAERDRPDSAPARAEEPAVAEAPREAAVAPKPAAAEAGSPVRKPASPPEPVATDDLAAVRELAGMAAPRRPGQSGQSGSAAVALRTGEDASEDGERWVPSRERVVWEWPTDADRIVEDF